jgi:hypothetical protein
MPSSCVRQGCRRSKPNRAQALREATEASLASKQDLNEAVTILRHKIADLKADLMTWMLESRAPRLRWSSPWLSC